MELIITDVTKMESCGNYPVSLASFTISLGSLAIHLKPSKLGTGMAYILFSHTYCTKKKKKSLEEVSFAVLKLKELQESTQGIFHFSQMYSWFVCLLVLGKKSIAKPSEN